MIFNALKELYRRNKITKNGLKKAVEDGLLSTEEYALITSEDY